jgi:hypothetical protein
MTTVNRSIPNLEDGYGLSKYTPTADTYTYTLSARYDNLFQSQSEAFCFLSFFLLFSRTNRQASERARIQKLAAKKNNQQSASNTMNHRSNINGIAPAMRAYRWSRRPTAPIAFIKSLDHMDHHYRSIDRDAADLGSAVRCEPLRRARRRQPVPTPHYRLRRETNDRRTNEQNANIRSE